MASNVPLGHGEATINWVVVPRLRADGWVMVDERRYELDGELAYHDHNWGVWRAVTWEWGAGTGRDLSLLYGGVYAPDRTTSPFFLTLVDSLGV